MYIYTYVLYLLETWKWSWLIYIGWMAWWNPSINSASKLAVFAKVLACDTGDHCQINKKYHCQWLKKRTRPPPQKKKDVKETHLDQLITYRSPPGVEGCQSLSLPCGGACGHGTVDGSGLRRGGGLCQVQLGGSSDFRPPRTWCFSWDGMRILSNL